MMQSIWPVLALALLAPVALAQTTRPAATPLEVRAINAFNAEDYEKALPLLRRLAEQAADQPERLGPIQEKIRVCERNIQAAKLAERAAELPRPPATRKPHVRPKDGQALQVTIQQLGNFNYDAEKGGNIPEDVLLLDGATIRIPGYMIPLDQADRITEFALVPSLFACCFGQPPQVHHTIIVRCPPGKGVPYFPNELLIEGRLTVDEKKDHDLIISVFEIDATSVKPAPR